MVKPRFPHGSRWLTRRTVGLTILAVAGFSLTSLAFQPQPRPRIPGISQIGPNLYVLGGSDARDEAQHTGGNVVVFVTESGVVLVDTKLPGYGAEIIDLVGTVTDKPITTIINTHTHWDHSGSNTEFPETVQFVAHENTRANMAQTTCHRIVNCQTFSGDNAKYLPSDTFSDRRTLFSGADRIDLLYFGRGHTNGDVFVVFPTARTVHAGDMMQRMNLPIIDVAHSGGDPIEFAQTLQRAVDGISGVDTVIPGHMNTPIPWSAFSDYSEFYAEVLGLARAAVEEGRDVGEAAAEISERQFDVFEVHPYNVLTVVQAVYDTHRGNGS